MWYDKFSRGFVSSCLYFRDIDLWTNFLHRILDFQWDRPLICVFNSCLHWNFFELKCMRNTEILALVFVKYTFIWECTLLMVLMTNAGSWRMSSESILTQIRYLRNNGTSARILLRFVIPHWGLSIVKRSDLKSLIT